jgi:hypothetical protein
VPAEEDVSVGLDQPLAFDDATPMVEVAAGPGVARSMAWWEYQTDMVLCSA